MVSFTEEPEGNLTTVYRTRSGREVRQVPRYEPAEDTIFIDEESPDSDYHENDGMVTSDDMDVSDGDSESEVSQTDSQTESESVSESESDDVSSLSSLTDEDFDILDWDRLTDDAKTDDESSEADDEYDDDEEDTEYIA